jgi:hypothetical protein
MSDVPTPPGPEPIGPPPDGADPNPSPPPAPDHPGQPVPPPAPGYGAPSYGTPSYDAPPTQPPAPGYGAPSYGAPPTDPGFGTPPAQPSYGAPPAPGYGAPSYGAPPTDPGYGMPPAQPSYGAPALDPYATPPAKTNGLAIAALVSSIVGYFCVLPFVLGIIFGAVSLGQIKKGNGTGRGLAIAGIVVGAVGLVAYSLLAALGVASWVLGSQTQSAPATTASTPSEDTSTVPDFTLPQGYVAGDCLSVVSEYYDMRDTDRADCAAPHGMEVLYTIDFPVAISSTDDPAINNAGNDCLDAMGSMVPDELYDESDVDIYFPSAAQWNAGERTAYCMLVPTYAGDQLSGSVVAGNYAGTVGS